MLPKTPTHTQGNLFQSSLPDMLDIQDPLIILADSIDWQKIEEQIISFYSDKGRPAKPIA